jgi:hypothetical protein
LVHIFSAAAINQDLSFGLTEVGEFGNKALGYPVGLAKLPA